MKNNRFNLGDWLLIPKVFLTWLGFAFIFFTLYSCGSNTLTSKNDGDVIFSGDVNQFRTALNLDIVPRNSSGVGTDIAGGLGLSSLRWDSSFIKEITIGVSANNVTIAETTSRLTFSVAGTEVASINANGFDGADVESGTMAQASLVDDTVDIPKIADVNLVVSANTSGAFTTSSATYVDCRSSGSVDLSITTQGNPVEVGLITQGTPTEITGFECNDSDAGCIAFIKIKRDSTDILFVKAAVVIAGATSVVYETVMTGIREIDQPAAGTYTYKIECRASDGNLFLGHARLYAREMK